MRWNVEYSAQAKQDLRDIYEYIAQTVDKLNFNKIYELIEQLSCKSVADFNSQGGLCPPEKKI
jgi:plasmid stabilization system protein ParE